jgi:nicotinamidase-related amidase
MGKSGSARSGDLIAIEAEPYEFALEPEKAALVIIDMQRDFLEPGGFGESLGTMSLRCAGRSRRPAACSRRRGMPGSASLHTREGHRPDLADLPPAKKARGVG